MRSAQERPPHQPSAATGEAGRSRRERCRRLRGKPKQEAFRSFDRSGSGRSFFPESRVGDSIRSRRQALVSPKPFSSLADGILRGGYRLGLQRMRRSNPIRNPSVPPFSAHPLRRNLRNPLNFRLSFSPKRNSVLVRNVTSRFRDAEKLGYFAVCGFELQPSFNIHLARKSQGRKQRFVESGDILKLRHSQVNMVETSPHSAKLVSAV